MFCLVCNPGFRDICAVDVVVSSWPTAWHRQHVLMYAARIWLKLIPMPFEAQPKAFGLLARFLSRFRSGRHVAAQDYTDWTG